MSAAFVHEAFTRKACGSHVRPRDHDRMPTAIIVAVALAMTGSACSLAFVPFADGKQVREECTTSRVPVAVDAGLSLLGGVVALAGVEEYANRETDEGWEAEPYVQGMMIGGVLLLLGHAVSGVHGFLETKACRALPPHASAGGDHPSPSHQTDERVIRSTAILRAAANGDCDTAIDGLKQVAVEDPALHRTLMKDGFVRHCLAPPPVEGAQ